MKQLVSLSLFLFLLFSTGTTSEEVVVANGATVSVEAYGDDGLRIRIAPPGSSIVDPPVQALGHLSKSYELKTNGGSSFENGNIQANVDANGLVTVTRLSDNVVLLASSSFRFGNVQGESQADNLVSASVSFSSKRGESIYGFGEHRTGSVRLPIPYTHRFQDSQIYTYSHGSDITIPMYTSTLGYNFLWNLPSFGSFSVDAQANFTWTAEATTNIDFWVSTTQRGTNNTFQNLISNYASATGLPPAFPYFASGFWQSKNRYRRQSELLEVAQGYVSRGLPLSVIVVDWFHWVNFGDWAFNEACWPDPAGMVSQLKSMGIEVMVSAWPLVANQSHNWLPMEQKGYLVKDSKGVAQPWHNPQYIYDPFNSDARDYVFNALKEGYVNNGIKIFWLDASEPERFTPDQSGQYYYNAGRDLQVGMAFPRMHQEMVYNGLKSLGESEIIMLSRSGWAGTARYGAATWSGDIVSTFDELAIQVKVAQGVAMSGLYWWTTDIGGYANGDITTPNFQELIVRWFQFGAFCPLFRLHGCRNPGDPPDNLCGSSCGPNEVWEFGNTAYEAIAPIIRLREQLRPYIMKNMNLATEEGIPIVRPMFFEFSNDPNCQGTDVEDQYMFGPDWLVAPVVAYQSRERSVYLPTLPANEVWVHYFTQTQFKGGARLNFQAPLESFPLFYRVITN